MFLHSNKIFPSISDFLFSKSCTSLVVPISRFYWGLKNESNSHTKAIFKGLKENRQKSIVELHVQYSICAYRKVANSNLSQLVACFQIFIRLMKGKFDAYVLWPLAKNFQNWIVDRSTGRDFTVIMYVPLPFWTGEIQRIACEWNWFLLLL